jgi:hypothetical protein
MSGMRSKNLPADMGMLAGEFVKHAAEFGYQLDYSQASIAEVERMIDELYTDWRPWRRGKIAKKNLPIASLVGAYVGEVMVRELGARWGWMPDFDVAAVQGASGVWTSPPAKAGKRFTNGREDDLVAYYSVLAKELSPPG